MKPLSEIAPGLLVIQIQIQAVWDKIKGILFEASWYDWVEVFFRLQIKTDSVQLWPVIKTDRLSIFIKCCLSFRYHSRFLYKLGLEIIIFSLHHINIRPTKIIKDLIKDRKILILSHFSLLKISGIFLNVFSMTKSTDGSANGFVMYCHQ